MFKFALLALVALAALQRAPAAPAYGDSDSSPLPQLRAIAQASGDVVVAAYEFVRQVTETALLGAATATVKFCYELLFKAYVLIVASHEVVPRAASLGMSAEQLRQVHIVAKATVALRQRLDTMERAESVLNSVVAEAVPVITKENLRQIRVKERIVFLCQRLHQRFEEEPQLRSAYKSLRDKAEKSTPLQTNLDSGESDEGRESAGREFQLLGEAMRKLLSDWEQLPKEVRARLLKTIGAKLFLHHAVNRVTIFDREYFYTARSMLELAKTHPLSKQQKILDEAVHDASTEVAAADPRGMFFEEKFATALFAKLEKKFLLYPSLRADLEKVKHDVALSHEWDASFWDWDILLL